MDDLYNNINLNVQLNYNYDDMVFWVFANLWAIEWFVSLNIVVSFYMIALVWIRIFVIEYLYEELLTDFMLGLITLFMLLNAYILSNIVLYRYGI